MADVFVSYKKEERDLAEQVVTAVTSAGYTVWWDDDLTPRRTWDAEIEQEIRAAKAVLVLWTPLAVLENSFVRAEAHYAKDSGKLVPVSLRRCELPLAFRQYQTIDLSSWNRNDLSDARWLRVLGWIRSLVVVPKNTVEAPPRAQDAQKQDGGQSPARPASPLRLAIAGVASVGVIAISLVVLRLYSPPQQHPLRNSAVQGESSPLPHATGPIPASTQLSQPDRPPTYIELSDVAWGQMRSGGNVPGVARQLVDRFIAVQRPLGIYDVQVGIYATTEIGAGAIANNRIWVTTGMLNYLARRQAPAERVTNEFATILALSYAHLLLRHDVRRSAGYTEAEVGHAIMLAQDLLREAGFDNSYTPTLLSDFRAIDSNGAPRHFIYCDLPTRCASQQRGIDQLVAQLDFEGRGSTLARVRAGEFL